MVSHASHAIDNNTQQCINECLKCYSLCLETVQHCLQMEGA